MRHGLPNKRPWAVVTPRHGFKRVRKREPPLEAATRGPIMRATMMDQCVRLAMAIIIIALVSITLYNFSSRTGSVAPSAVGDLSYRH